MSYCESRYISYLILFAIGIYGLLSIISVPMDTFSTWNRWAMRNSSDLNFTTTMNSTGFNATKISNFTQSPKSTVLQLNSTTKRPPPKRKTVSTIKPKQCVSTIIRKATKIPINSKFKGTFDIFVYSSFIDRRWDTGAHLRIAYLSRCPKKSMKIVVEVDSMTIPMISDHIEFKCPHSFARGCKYNAFIMTSSMPIPEPFSDNYTLYLDSNKTLYSPLVVYPEKTYKTEDRKQGHTICVPPLYWYSDWTKILFSVEAWKLHGATDIIVYYYSGTKDVKKVLEYYKNYDTTLTLVEWPLLENTSRVDPNKLVYRIAQNVALNDCLMRSRTHYVIHVDFDEIIVPIRGTLQHLIEWQLPLNGASLGHSLTFKHYILVFHKNLAEDYAFSGLDQMYMFIVAKAPKVVARVKSVYRYATHRVPEYINTCFVEIPMSRHTAKLLHHRVDFNVSTAQYRTRRKHNVVLGKNALKQNMVNAVRNVFGKHPPKINKNISLELTACLENWRAFGCKTPISICSAALRPLAEWDEVNSTIIPQHIFTTVNNTITSSSLGFSYPSTTSVESNGSTASGIRFGSTFGSTNSSFVVSNSSTLSYSDSDSTHLTSVASNTTF